MAKKETFREVHTDIQEEFEGAIYNTNLCDNVKIKLVSNTKLKKEVTQVKKQDPLNAYLSGEEVIILINDNIFEQLDPLQRKMVIDETLASIEYDSETDKITLKKGDVNTFSLLLQRHGLERYLALKLSIESLFAKAAGEDAAQADA